MMADLPNLFGTSDRPCDAHSYHPCPDRQGETCHCNMMEGHQTAHRCRYCRIQFVERKPPTPKDPPHLRRGLARRTDPDTSHDAARSVDVRPLEWDILVALHALGGRGTIHEIHLKSGRAEVSVSPRLKPLEQKGYVRRTTDRKANPGTQHRAIIWELATRLEV